MEHIATFFERSETVPCGITHHSKGMPSEWVAIHFGISKVECVSLPEGDMDEIRVDGHLLLIDRDATYNYHDMFNEKCSCCYDRNFFMTVYDRYPQTIALLKSLGIDVEYPIEIMEFGYEPDKRNILYHAYYSVKGALPADMIEFVRESATITCSGRKDAGYSNTGMSEPCFIVEIKNLYLPWLLDEPYPG